jgi:hypothetical protein
MGWKIRSWICGGFQAVRPDGEKIYIYSRLSWEPAHYGENASSYEFRWHGRTAGRLTSENTWRRNLRLCCTLGAASSINEQDLLEISMLLADKPKLP